jgi:hypothetical protein
MFYVVFAAFVVFVADPSDTETTKILFWVSRY